MPPITGFHHLSLTVSDREKSVAWHSEVEDDTFSRTRLRQPDSGIVITFTEHNQGSDDRFVETRTGLDHLSLQVPSIEALQAWKPVRGGRGRPLRDQGDRVRRGDDRLPRPRQHQLELFATQ